METQLHYNNLDLADIVYFNEEVGEWLTEQWKDIIGYENIYQASTFGRIKSMKRRRVGRTNISTLVKERIRKQSLCEGYLKLTLHKSGKITKKYVHILIAETFIPNPDNKPEVNHLKKAPCGTKMNTLDNRVESLMWSTRGENMKYGYDFGFKCAKGENNGQSKLTTIQVLEIRAIGKYRNYTKELSVKYGVGEKYISDIMNRKRWTHI
jgi:hypothetical protein